MSIVKTRRSTAERSMGTLLVPRVTAISLPLLISLNAVYPLSVLAVTVTFKGALYWETVGKEIPLDIEAAL
ncbi:hypothetical protein [Spirosoma foliorum]|uniref:Uncharacterized protein n=1 Tax=Spirosoma foliorum TaxID=2710596 RepID=A0A7G5H6L5_9BACT|nr:hypothetical protein [Spirosoma foliorum]QMW06757.1 hypothetical protein H3H32_18625 [Spirosoma foliorum]